MHASATSAIIDSAKSSTTHRSITMIKVCAAREAVRGTTGVAQCVAERGGGECSMMWPICRGRGIYLAFQSSARCAARSTNGASLPPGRCTASGRAARTRTTGGLQPHGPSLNQADSVRANGPEGTCRPVPASDNYHLARGRGSPHLRLRAILRSPDPAAGAACLPVGPRGIPG